MVHSSHNKARSNDNDYYDLLVFCKINEIISNLVIYYMSRIEISLYNYTETISYISEENLPGTQCFLKLKQIGRSR